MDDDQQFCLRWNNHQSTLISVFDTLLENGTLVDCTLAAEGKFLKAHKVVLSACSPYFAALLSQQYDKHPIFILKDVKFQELRAMMDYMYRGEVNISQDQLAALLKAAESLQIKGLSDNRGSSSSAAAPPSQQKQQQSETAAAKSLPPPVPVNKASGLTIENKRPLKSELHDAELSGSREGSTSPTSRKRKKIRRGSVETNNLTDNHDQHSNSSSHSMHSSLQPQALALTSGSSAIVASVPAINNAATSLSSSSSSTAAVAATSAAAAATSANVLAATASAVAAAASAAIKKTESVQQQQVAEALKLQLVKQHLPTTTQQQQQHSKAQTETEDEEQSEAEQGDGHGEDDSDNEMDEPQSKRRQAQGGDGEDGKSINQSELMIEPKNEYDDGQDENVEDLTLDEEELLDDLDQAGPSHGEGSSQGYAQWQMEREQNEAFMAAQDAVGGQHRDAQDARPAKPQAVTSAAAAKKVKTITVTTPQLTTTTSATTLESAPPQLAQITANTPVILNDLNDCLLESKNIVVSKRDNKFILFTTSAPEPVSLQPAVAATASQIQSITLQPLQVSAAASAAPTATLHTATVIDTGRIEELLKRDKIIKKTELQSDGTTTTTYIFDECDILPLKTTSKNVINTATPNVQLATAVKPPATLSIVKVAPDNVIATGGGTTATVVPAVSHAALPASLISASPNPSQIISTKKLLKPTHPRIKYSKHKNPSVQSVATLPILTIPTVPSSNSGQSLSLSVPEAPVGTTTTKIELLNFSLSRKFPGQNTKTIDVSNIQQIPISAVSKPVPTTRYTVSDYETITSNTSQSNDFTSGMIDDLDYSVIDDIELPDDVQVNFAESYSSSKGAHGTTTEDDEEDGDDSQDAPKPLPAKKPTAKTEAKILNATMDDKYALLANTSIMKNFEYTVNESVVSDGDDGEMRQYICRHCGKRYRWKSTLRRHENVECGGKEAMHQCPYCTYKAKQRGNLGVHIRKHHSDMPQLESRRKSKTRDSLNLIESIKAEAEGQL